MKQGIPPTVLLKTWLELLKWSDDEEQHRHAKRMLVRHFGSVDIACMFAEENGIETK